MTKKQLTTTISKNRLSLDSKSFWKYYEAPLWTSFISICMLGYFIYQTPLQNFKIETPMLLLLLLPAITLALWVNLYLALRCKKIDTNVNAETVYKIAKLALETLEWPVYKHAANKYLHATNPFGDIRTWGDEMITVVVAENKILVNSICNLHYGPMAQAALSFGKNRQNVRKFIETFTTLSQYSH